MNPTSSSLLEMSILQAKALRQALSLAIDNCTFLKGNVLQVGFSDGRAYDHLHSNMPYRKIVVVDRKLRGHVLYQPPASDVILCDYLRVPPNLNNLNKGDFALAICILNLSEEQDQNSITLLAQWIHAAVCDNGILVSDSSFPTTHWQVLEAIPEINSCWRVYRRIQVSCEQT